MLRPIHTISEVKLITRDGKGRCSAHTHKGLADAREVGYVTLEEYEEIQNQNELFEEEKKKAKRAAKKDQELEV